MTTLSLRGGFVGLALSLIPALAGAMPALAQEFDAQLPVAGLFAVTGSNASFGIAYSQGLELAAQEINEAGGIQVGDQSYEVVVYLSDTQGDPARAVSEAQRLLADGVRIFYCCNLSAESVPVLTPVLGRGGLIFSQNAATAQFLGQPGHELQFKNYNVEAGETGTVLQWVQFITETYPDAETVAIVVPSDESGQIYADTYQQSFEQLGVEVVALERYDHGATDFSAQLTRVRAAAPDILVAGYSDEVRGLFRQAREFGIEAKYVGTQGVSGDSGAGLDEFLYTGVSFGADQTDSRIVEFAERLEAFAGDVNSFNTSSILTYDWLYILKQAIEDSGTTDLPTVAEHIRNGTFEGVYTWAVNDIGLGRSSSQGILVKDGTVTVTTLPVPQ